MGANSIAPNVLSTSAFRTMAPNGVNLIFNAMLRKGSMDTENWLAQWASATPPVGNTLTGAPIEVITDFKKAPGTKAYFTVMEGMNTAPILGDNMLAGNEQTFRFGTFEVNIDVIRHGAGWNRKQLAIMAAGGNVVGAMADAVDGLMGRTKRHFILQRLRQRTAAGNNLLYPSSARPSLNAMTSADYISTTVIEKAAAYLNGIGGRPISMKKLKNGAKVPGFLFFGPSEVLNPLYQDTAYSNASNYALERGEENVQFSGGFVPWRGQSIYHVPVVDEDVRGPIGSHFSPKARLGVAVAPATTAITLRGGGTKYDVTYAPAVDYFRDFPSGNAYGKQYDEEVLSSDTTSYYIKIVTPTGAWGMVRYLGNSNIGTAITTAAYDAAGSGNGGRLSALSYAASGGGAATCHNIVGSVTWDATKNTETWPQDSIMYYCNALGNIIGFIGVLGSSAVLVAHGGGAFGNPNASIAGTTNYQGAQSIADGGVAVSRDDDYGMKKSVAAEGVFGVDVPKSSAGTYMNHLIIPVVYTPSAGGGL